MRNQAVFYVVLALLVGLAAWMVHPFAAAMVVASIFGYLLMPVFEGLGRWIPNVHLRATLLLLVVLFTVALPAIIALPKLIHQSRTALRQDSLLDGVAQVNDTLDGVLKRHVPLTENFAELSAKVRGTMVSSAPSIIGRIGTTAIDLIVFLYTLFFVLVEGREIGDDLIRLVPLDAKMKPHLVESITATMTGVLYGQVITAAAQAVLAAIGYAFAGVPHLLLWTVLTFIAAMLPVAGGALVWVPVAVSRLIVGDATAGWGLMIYMGVFVSAIDHVLKPRLISGRAPLHPLAALVGVLGGLHFFGITGFLIGPMLLGLLSAMLRFYRELPHYQESNLTP